MYICIHIHISIVRQQLLASFDYLIGINPIGMCSDALN